MALASCSVKIISRGKGRSAVAAAAYRSAQDMQNEYDGVRHDYSRKQGVVYTDILTPQGAPEWTHDRQQLWNKVEEIEKRRDAQLAREVMIALPQELSPAQNIELAKSYAQTFVQQGMIADVAVHDGQDGNPHAHIMLTMRPIDEDGFSKKKNRDWNANEKLLEWREQYETITNEYLERYGHEERIDVRSYAEQGIEQTPTIHLGQHAHRMEKKGIKTDRGDINRDIQEDNRQRAEINREITLLEQEKESLKFKGDDIEQYGMVSEEVQNKSEALERLRLTEGGKGYSGGQQKNTEDAHPPAKVHEPSAHHTPMDEPERQERPSFGEPSGIPAKQPEPHQEQAHLRSKDSHGSSGGHRSPNFDEPHARPPHHPTPGQDSPSHESRLLSAARKSGVAEPHKEPPQPKSQETPAHHSRAPSSGGERKLSHRERITQMSKESIERRQKERDSRSREDPVRRR